MFDVMIKETLKTECMLHDAMFVLFVLLVGWLCGLTTQATHFQSCRAVPIIPIYLNFLYQIKWQFNVRHNQ